MKIKIYQINGARDEKNVMFLGYEITKRIMGGAINSDIYDCVFDGDIDCEDLEAVYRTFNVSRPEGYEGRSLSVSDIVEVVDADKVEPGLYFVDNIGFENIEQKEDRK